VPATLAVLVSAAAVLTPAALRAGDLPRITSVERILHGPAPLDAFRRPMGLAADRARGVLVIADTGNHRLLLVDSTGRSRGGIPCAADEAQGRSICEPRSVALDPRGRLVVVDGAARGIEVLTATGSRLAVLDPAPPEAIGSRPSAVAVGGSGRIYVVYAGQRPGLVVVEPGGTRVLAVGFTADAPFRGPVGVAVDSSESCIAVVDPEADRVVSLWSSDGTRLAAFGTHGEGDGTFSMAVHAAWGPGETLWVTDTIRHSISVFDRGGRFAGRIGGFGRGPGQFDYPVGCVFLAPDRLAVLERAGARLQVLGVDVGKAWAPQTRLGTETVGSEWSMQQVRAEVN
jgi:DNA-binding beta-propeller fold protein YncE